MFQKWWQDLALWAGMVVGATAVVCGVASVYTSVSLAVIGVFAGFYSALNGLIIVYFRRNQKHHAGPPPPQEPQGIEIEL